MEKLISLQELDETRLRTWISVTIPLVYRGELSILELLLKLFLMIQEIGEGVEGEIDYQKIVEELLKYTEFFKNLEQFINDYLDELKLGTGNLSGKIKGKVGWSIGVNNTPGAWYSVYDSDEKIVYGIKAMIEATNMAHLVTQKIKLRVDKELIGSFPDEKLYFYIVRSEEATTSWNNYIYQAINSTDPTIPFGERTFYMQFTKINPTTALANGMSILSSFYTSGKTLNKLNYEVSGYGYADVISFAQLRGVATTMFNFHINGIESL